jgi:hypothetical protein
MITLAVKTEFPKELPPHIFKDYGVRLAKAAKSLFQWAAVAG